MIFFNFMEAISLCDIINIYLYIHFIQNTNKTHKVTCYNLVVRGNMFRPHCGHLQANLYRSSAFNVCILWGPVVCTIVMYVE